jgi:hypothetical protein
MARDLINKFFKDNGFKIESETTSNAFGDYFDIFSNGDVIIRVCCTKNIEYIEVSNFVNENDWYDLVLLQSINYRNIDLISKRTINDYFEFLKSNFIEIIDFMSKSRYWNSIIELKKIEERRLMQMFPELKLNSEEKTDGFN